MKLSLKYKFLFPTVSIFIICMGLVVAVSYVIARNAMEKIIREQIVQTSEITIKNIDEWIGDRKLDVIGWSRQNLFRTAVKDTYMGKNARQSANPVLSELLKTHPFYEDICIANTKGDIVSSSHPEMRGKYNIKETSFFKEGMTGKTVLTNVIKCFLAEELVFIIASPIYENKEITGLLFAGITLEYFNQQFIHPIKVCKTGYAFLYQMDGLFISHPDPLFVMKKNISEFDFGSLFLASEKGIISYFFRGENKIAAIETIKNQGWKIGVSVKEVEIFEPAIRLRNIIFFILSISIIIVTGFVFMMSSFVTRPLREVSERLRDIAEGNGNLSARLEINSKDEIGELAEWFNLFVENLRKIISNISGITTHLKKTSPELASLSSNMASSTNDLDSQSDMVAEALTQVMSHVNHVVSATGYANTSVSEISVMTDEISLTFDRIADFANKTSGNVKEMARSSNDISSGIYTVASAVEEMTISLNEVAKHTTQASRVSQNANHLTEEIDLKMNGLVTSSKQIGKVVGMIKNIADQTNMLALNATIEAAGAGVAGRGFAVVANEVKELAKQSADATDIITEKIGQIQISINETVETIGGITKIINEIADINSSVAASVEKQTSNANDISVSVAENADVVRKVAENAAESSQFVEEIATSTTETSETAKDIAEHVNKLVKMITNIVHSSTESADRVTATSDNIQIVNMASKSIASGATQIEESSKLLADQATALSKIVQQFQL